MIKSNKVLFAETCGIFKGMEMNDFAQTMADESIERGISVGESETKSWKENFKAIKQLLQNSKIPDDVVIAFEYQVPIGGRVDCMLFGMSSDGEKNIIHIELKQWDNSVKKSFKGKNYITTVLIGGRYYSHPSAQAESYQVHLLTHLKVLSEKDIHLKGVVYCYNYYKNQQPCVLLDPSYEKLLERCPLFCKDQSSDLILLLERSLGCGSGYDVFKEFINSEIFPTAKLHEAAKGMLDGVAAQKEFELIGEQRNAYDFIYDAVKNTSKDEKTVVIVKGGPGTGKSVIAIQLIAGLAKTGKFNNVFYATRSTSLIHGYQDILRGANYSDNQDNAAIDLFKKNARIKPALYGENGIDALLVDEAHRIEQSSNDSNDKNPNEQTHLSQMMNLIFCSRVSVFFIDDFQSVKSIEKGSSDAIENAAKNYYNRIVEENNHFIKVERLEKLEEAKRDLEKAVQSGKDSEIVKKEKVVHKYEIDALQWPVITQPSIKHVKVVKYDLTDQFRCNGSNNYLDWVEHVLYNSERTQNVKLDLSKYEFGVFDTPQELYAKIRQLDDFARYSDQKKEEMGESFTYEKLSIESELMEFKQTARLVAGWCWPWKQDQREKNGDLLHEITIPEHGFSMPWETLKGAKSPINDYEHKYARNQDLWLIDKEGVNQVGCNHSSQGWEVDYIGVIIARDIKYDSRHDCLCTDNTVKNYDKNVPNSKNKASEFDRITRNIYRVLLTRGKKGCFIFCCDPEVGEYFKRCMNQ